jgi:hypothetical protein
MMNPQISSDALHRGLTRQLPADRTCASAARALLKAELQPLALPTELLDNIELMGSEVAGNAVLHGYERVAVLDGARLQAPCPPELWVYTRTRPSPQLVVGVYDPRPEWISNRTSDDADGLPESGRGIGIVQLLSAEFGWRPTLSRLAATPLIGKVVYFTVPAPVSYTRIKSPHIPAAEAAIALCSRLTTRGIPGLRICHGDGRSLVSLQCGFTIWAENPGVFRWQDPNGTYQRQPYLDLIDVTETTVQRHIQAVLHP